MVTLLAVAALPTGQAPAADSAPTEIALHECLVLPPVGRAGRSPVHTDALEAQLVASRWEAPEAGVEVALPDGSTRSWAAATANAEGWVEQRALGGGYAYWAVDSDAERVMLLEASGHSMVYVNGEPRAGDPYAYGWLQTPVLLHGGSNELLFQCARGRLRAKLVEPEAKALLNPRDPTLPDLIVGERTDTWAGVVVLNATAEPLAGLRIDASIAGGRATFTPVSTLPPLSMRKAAIRLRGSAPAAAGECDLSLALVEAGRRRHSATLKLRVREPQQTQKRAFVSSIDGSVQYYAVNPAQGPMHGPPALILTCHGAAVEAIGQADAYSAKSWGHIVAPTNRRPYGFDWEDWGRLDAMEVLDLAQKRLGADPQRTYLTGHSMGGHGVWHLGLTYPGRFAAIGPSASWISFRSYAGGARTGNPSPVEELLQRAAAPSDTLSLLPNAGHYGVYILHGEKDDNVPVEQAREMNAELGKFHHDLVFHEEPGMGHWWDISDEPGADCVDWAPMFDFFACHALPADEAVREIEFTTACPAVSASSHWLTIHAQEEQLKPSTVTIRCDPWKRRFVGATQNVLRLALDVAHLPPGGRLSVELDGQKIESIPWPEGEPRLWLERANGAWTVTSLPSPALKGPHRAGLFKEAFRNRVVFVYGTRGTAQETAWALAKARYDAETFYYRGNASVDLIADAEFDASAEPDRNAVLYGNADTNAAWKTLLADSPVQVRRGEARVGERVLSGNDLACYFVRPRPHSEVASVGVVAGTGSTGQRLAERSAYFISGAAYPDVLAIGPRMLSEGAEGLRAVGFFGQDWSVEPGQQAAEVRSALETNAPIVFGLR